MTEFVISGPFSMPIREKLVGHWICSFAAGYFFLAVGILIWLFLTPPGAAHKDPLAQYILCASLIVSRLFKVLTIVAGFARDIQQKEGSTDA